MKQIKEPKFKADKITLKEYLQIYSGVKIPWLFLVGIIAVQLVSMEMAVYTTQFTGDMVDASGAVPVKELVYYAVVSILYSILAVSSGLLSSFADQRINLGVRGKLWRKVIYIKQTYYDKDGGERLVSRITHDCANASTLFTSLISVFTMLQMFYIYMEQMFMISPFIARWVLLIIPIGLVLTWAMSKLRAYAIQRVQATLSSATNYLIERTRDLLLIKACGAEENEAARGELEFQRQYHAQIYTGLVTQLDNAVRTIMDMLSTMIPFVLGSIYVSQGVITSGEVIMMYSFSQMASVCLVNAGVFIISVAEAAGGLSQVNRAFHLPEEDYTSGRSMDCNDGDVTLTNVTFGYQEDSPVLKNISCSIPAGKVTALIGANGSGKSTIFKLLDRLYDLQGGTIYFDGVDAKEFKLQEWRRSFGMVAQGSPLMAGTIRENLTYGCRRQVTEEELIRAAKDAQAYDFIAALPDGFDSEVAIGGSNFSGGQRQCLAIARAMLNSPDYLLLDEATSNLDSTSERIVTEALSRLMEKRTTVVIAHSLAAIRNADHVIVLRDGQVESTGSPQEIMKITDNYLSWVMERKKK